MRIVSRTDIRNSVITGVTTGVIAWFILDFLDKGLPLGIPLWVLAVGVPILWILGVQLGYTLGVVFAPFTQFGRFAAIGFTNAAVDFGVLYLFIALTGLVAGAAYAIFKLISFTVASIHSYFWNKTWTFENVSAGGSQEITRFILVVIAAAIVNVATASLVVAFRPAGVDPKAWAAAGAAAGSAVALIFSFIGFRLFVFRKKA